MMLERELDQLGFGIHGFGRQPARRHLSRTPDERLLQEGLLAAELTKQRDLVDAGHLRDPTRGRASGAGFGEYRKCRRQKMFS